MKIPQNNLRYILECDGYGTKEVHPMGESSFKLNYELANDPTDPTYRYDITFDGSFIFTGEDFQWLYGAETGGFKCTDMIIHLQSVKCGEEDILAGTKVKLSQGTWALDACKVTLPVINIDPYEIYNEKKGDALDIFTAVPDPQTVRMYDYEPVFEYSYMPFDAAGGAGFDFTDQQFENFPNQKAQYPGFAADGEVAYPYWPEGGIQTLFLTADLKNLTRNPVTFEEILNTGSLPMHIDFPGEPFIAANNGWRIYYFRYRIRNNAGMGSAMNYEARYRWVREIKDVPAGTAMTAEWVYVSTAGGLDRYARPPILIPRKNIYKPSFTNDGYPNEYIVLFEGSYYITGIQTDIVNAYDDNDEAGIYTGTLGNRYGFESLINGKILNDLITYTAGYCFPGLTVKSEFFQINPSTVTGINYVTGEQTQVDKIIIFQKSDVKRPWASEQATIGTYTPDELWGWLLAEFKVKIAIFGNVLRVEHIISPYFRKPATIDLTTPPYNAMLRGTRTYSYDTSDLKAKETFEFMESRKQTTFLPSDDFAGEPILYYGSCVNREAGQNITDRSLSRITNDVLYILVSSGGSESKVVDNDTSNKYRVQDDNSEVVISDDGFTFVASKIVGGVRYGISDVPILSNKTLINNVMGWALLHDKYYRDEANAPTGSMNGTDVVFNTTKYAQKQIKLPFTLCCVQDFDPYEQIVSELGTGIVKTAQWTPGTQVMQVELLFKI